MFRNSILPVFCILFTAACSEEKNELLPDQIFDLNIESAGPYFADGSTEIDVSAFLKVEADKEFRRIIFESSAGTFDPKVIEIGSDNRGEAKLKPGLQPGDFKIKASIEGKSEIFVEESIKLQSRQNDDVLTLTFDKETDLKADGVDILTGTLSLNNYITSSVDLSTNLGMFIKTNSKATTLQLTPGNHQTFIFRVEINPDPHILTAQIEGTSIKIDKILTLDKAYPDSIYLQPSSFEIDSASGQITLETLLFRKKGKVSLGVDVTFDAYQVSELNQVGRFKDLPRSSSANQKVNVVYTLDTRKAMVNIPLTIRGTTRNDANEPIVNTVNITVFKQE